MAGLAEGIDNILLSDPEENPIEPMAEDRQPELIQEPADAAGNEINIIARNKTLREAEEARREKRRERRHREEERRREET